MKTESIATLVSHLTATADFSVLKDLDAVSICVPTPLRQTGDPDMSFILSATEELAKYMHQGMIVLVDHVSRHDACCCCRSLAPSAGLTMGRLVPCLSPSVWTRRGDFTTINTPKVMGDYRGCNEVAGAWYEGAIQTVHRVSSAEAAEMAKLLENTFRMINIGLSMSWRSCASAWAWTSGR